LANNPSFLSERGRLAHRLDDYAQVAYLVVARDQFLWPDTPDLIVVDYEVFKERLIGADSLSELIGRLGTYDWMPVENTHFSVRFEPRTANGVTVESEIFYRIP